MNKFNLSVFLFFLFLLTSSVSLLAQSDSTKIIKPILLDKEAMSGIGLQRIKLKHEPKRAFFQRNLFRGEDLSIYIVSSESWKTSFENFSFDELVYMLNGRAKVKPKGGEEQTFNSNEFLSVPKGYSGSWEVIAGDNYHYELSVITTKRASQVDTLENKIPMLLDKSKVSGVDIHLDAEERYEEVLFRGSELKFSMMAEKPREVYEVAIQKDRLVCILSGQVKITDASGIEKAFYTGDFLVLPKRFRGKWKSQGHGLFKAIVVERTNEI